MDAVPLPNRMLEVVSADKDPWLSLLERINAYFASIGYGRVAMDGSERERVLEYRGRGPILKVKVSLGRVSEKGSVFYINGGRLLDAVGMARFLTG